MIMPSKAYKEWHDEKMWILKGSPAIKGPVELKMTLYAKDKRAGDLSNKFESVADLLVDARIIEDDNWNIVRKVEMMFGGIDKENPRVEIEINKKDRFTCDLCGTKFSLWSSAALLVHPCVGGKSRTADGHITEEPEI